MLVRFTPALAIIVFISIGIPHGIRAQTARDASARDPRTGALRTAKGPLPDPVLLDGSKFEAEKRSEYGMLGEFDMPGDEKAKSERVSKSGKDASGGGPGEKSGSGKPGSGKEESGGLGGGQTQQGKEGTGDAAQEAGPQGTAEGTQIKELQGEAQTASAGQSGKEGKPQQLTIGDTAMQIKPQTEVPGLVGDQQQPVGKDVPQQYDKNTPAGGKQSPSRGNRGVEKGRDMPAGI